MLTRCVDCGRRKHGLILGICGECRERIRKRVEQIRRRAKK